MRKNIIIAGHKIRIKYQVKDIIDENGNLLNGCYDNEKKENKMSRIILSITNLVIILIIIYLISLDYSINTAIAIGMSLGLLVSNY